MNSPLNFIHSFLTLIVSLSFIGGVEASYEAAYFWGHGGGQVSGTVCPRPPSGPYASGGEALSAANSYYECESATSEFLGLYSGGYLGQGSGKPPVS